MTDQDRPGWTPPATESSPVADLASGTHQATSNRSRRNRVGVGIAAALGVAALGVAGNAYAASSSPSPSPSGPDSGMHMDGQPGGGAPGTNQMPGQGPGHGPDGDNDGGHHRSGMGFGGGKGFGGGMGFGGGIHSSTVTAKNGGGYQTIDTQRGTVTAVSATSISVKSEDGFTATYIVSTDTNVNAQRDGIASVKTTDDVVVVGIESGSDVNAVQIMDRTQLGNSKAPLQPPAETNPDGAGTAAPSSSA